MLGDISKAQNIYIACGKTDMRLSIDGLAALVQQNFQLNPFGSNLFLFSGGSKSKLKALYWEGDGFILLYKRLESSKFQWPRTTKEARLLTRQEFRWLLEGLSLDQPKAVKQIQADRIV